MNFLKSFGIGTLMIATGIAFCSQQTHPTIPNGITTVAPPLSPTEIEAAAKFQAAIDRDRINLLKKIAIDENRRELEECRANPKHQKNRLP